ncbi:MAG: hypothetical protein NTY12_01790 [Candidatus Falkowbacteria bacterium]|nr:hypothetical protein [Candidatus Falkowbacteria bacterium]
MKIHKLGFTIANSEDSEGFPQFLPTVDGHKEPASLLLLPLELSATKDAIYPILNCGCGEWDCGGYFIEVKNTEEYVIWNAIYGLGNLRKKIEIVHALTPIHFLRKEYEALINELLILKDNYKYEAIVYKIDKEQYEKSGLGSLAYFL